jgi:hypothetical protein
MAFLSIFFWLMAILVEAIRILNEFAKQSMQKTLNDPHAPAKAKESARKLLKQAVPPEELVKTSNIVVLIALVLTAIVLASSPFRG